MSTPNVPGVFVSVTDNTDFNPAAGQMTLCLIGGASKGPLNTPILFLDQADFINTMGPPLLTDYGIQAGVQFFAGGGSRLLYVRVAHNAIQADVPIPGLTAGTPAVRSAGTVSFTGSANPTDADLVTLHDIVPTLALNANSVGAAQNVTITKTGTSPGTVSGMAGGTVSTRAVGSIFFPNCVQPTVADTIVIGDGTTSVTFAFVASGASGHQVNIGADAYITMANLISKINTSGLAIAAVAVHQTQVYEMDNNDTWGVGHIPVLIGPTAAASLLNLLAAINVNATPALGIVASNNTVTVPALTLAQLTGGAKYNALVQESAVAIAVTGMTGGVDAIAGTSANVLDIQALNPGSWGNNVQVQIRASLTIGAPTGNFDILVFAPVDQSGVLQQVEQFNNMSSTSTDPRYVTSAVANGITGQFNPSNYIDVDVILDGGVPTAGTYVMATGGGATGTDGVSGLVYSDYVGSVVGQTPSGMLACRNPEKFQYNAIAIPGVSDQRVITALQALAVFRNNAQVILDPPFGATVQQIVDWHNGVSNVFANSPQSPLDSRFLTLYWSWVEVTDQYNSVNIFLPPSGFAAAAWANTDQNAGSQYAPAGDTYGLINGLELEYAPDQDDRGLLYANQNCINPIIDDSVNGLELYGNKTMQREPTFLTSLNVQRMLLTAQTVISQVSKKLVFAPNDPVYWKKLQTLVNPILAALAANNGLVVFKIVCDNTTNTPQVIANKQMICRIVMLPVLAAEEILLNFNLISNTTQLASA